MKGGKEKVQNPWRLDFRHGPIYKRIVRRELCAVKNALVDWEEGVSQRHPLNLKE